MNKDTFLKKTGFQYCPRCKSSDIEDGLNAMRCRTCGYRFFFNCAAAIGCILTRGSEIMLITRKNPPGKGMFDLPGGFVDYGERLEDGVIRELMEEINAEVSSIRYFASFPNTYLYQDVFYHTTDCFFTASLAEGSVPKAGDDAEAILWVPAKDIDFSLMAFDSAKQALKMYIETL